jgi:hypothetical protein
VSLLLRACASIRAATACTAAQSLLLTDYLYCLLLRWCCLQQIAGRVIRSDDQMLQEVEAAAELQPVPQAPALCLPLNMVRL